MVGQNYWGLRVCGSAPTMHTPAEGYFNKHNELLHLVHLFRLRCFWLSLAQGVLYCDPAALQTWGHREVTRRATLLMRLSFSCSFLAPPCWRQPFSATGGHARDVLHFVERVSDIDFESEASRNS